MELGNQPPFLYLLCLLTAVGGFLFGYDTGVVSGAMLMVRDDLLGDEKQEDADTWHEAIVTATIGAAAVFSLVSSFVSQRFGRKLTILLASFIFTVGAIIMGAAPSKEVLLVGRIIVGIGIGFSSSTVPMYIAEASPENIRGVLITMNQLMITFGILVSSIIDGLFANVSEGWRYDFGLGGVPSLFLLIGFLFCPESPRWLVKRGRVDEARAVLKRIRASGYNCEEELQDIVKVCKEDELLESQNSGFVLARMMKSAYVRKALAIGCLMQLFQQAAGINTVMYYSATIVEMAGLSSSQTTNIWIAVGINAVNFLFSFPGMYLIERLGRRVLTLISLLGIIISLLLLGIGFHLTSIHDPVVAYNTSRPSGDTNWARCSVETTCETCVSLEECGFCYKDMDGVPTSGSCDGAIDENAEYGRCATNPTGEFIWYANVCPSDYGVLVVIALCLYILFFASGLGATPWAINSEIYPLWCRSSGVGISTAVNWSMNVLVSMTFLTLISELGRQYTFFLYAGLSALGFLIFLLILPETKGKSLEEMEELFSRPLWRLGLNPGKR